MKIYYFISIIIIILIISYFLIKREGFENQNNDNNVYVINLDESVDRMERLMKDFSDVFSIYRTSAVKMTPGQQGCALSFVRIVKMAKEKDLPTVLIFEDDNKPEPNFYQNWIIIKSYLDSHMDEWEIFNGGMRNIMGIQKMIELESGIKLIKPTGGYSANWIYINSNVYDKILAWEAIGKPLIDLWFSNSFNIWCSYPILALQYSGKSDIEGGYREFSKEDEILKRDLERLISFY
uniref:Glycosyl transferase family 25 domain-containing protein n=1 Tax=viral metagenome TaxID=1070528 RepID=A0A6C0D7J1_9ZZZZ